MPIESFSDDALKIIEYGPIVPAVIGNLFDRPQPQEIPDEITAVESHLKYTKYIPKCTPPDDTTAAIEAAKRPEAKADYFQI